MVWGGVLPRVWACLDLCVGGGDGPNPGHGPRGWLAALVKRYPEPVAHGPEARKQMARRPGSRNSRTDAVNTVCQREIPFL